MKRPPAALRKALRRALRMAEKRPTRARLAELPVILDDAILWVTDRRATVRKYALAVALAFFAAGLVWAVRATPDLGRDFNFEPLILLLAIGAPISTVLSATETYAVSRIAGGPMRWRTCFELTIYSGAANMLPIPAGGLTKLVGMKAHGVGYRRGSAMLVLTFAIWGGLAFAYAGTALYLLAKPQVAVLFALGSVVLLVGAAAGFAQFGQWKLVVVIASMRLISFPLEAFRYLLALIAVGSAATYLQASTLVVGSFIASTIVIAPAGIGMTEAVVAVLASLVGISAATGFLAAAVGRIVRLLGLALMAGGLFLIDRRSRRDSPHHSGSA